MDPIKERFHIPVGAQLDLDRNAALDQSGDLKIRDEAIVDRGIGVNPTQSQSRPGQLLARPTIYWNVKLYLQ